MPFPDGQATCMIVNLLTSAIARTIINCIKLKIACFFNAVNNLYRFNVLCLYVEEVSSGVSLETTS